MSRPLPPALLDARVLDLHGASQRLGDVLASDGPIVLVFLRHFG